MLNFNIQERVRLTCTTLSLIGLKNSKPALSLPSSIVFGSLANFLLLKSNLLFSSECNRLVKESIPDDGIDDCGRGGRNKNASHKQRIPVFFYVQGWWRIYQNVCKRREIIIPDVEMFTSPYKVAVFAESSKGRLNFH